jgi:hypothetical protein
MRIFTPNPAFDELSTLRHACLSKTFLLSFMTDINNTNSTLFFEAKKPGQYFAVFKNII